MIANAKIHSNKNEIEAALGILSSISANSKYQLRAKAEMAYIYLNKRQDKLAFVKSYEDLVEQSPNNPNNLLSLADAYMSVQEPEKAIEMYERALEIDDSHLSTEISQKIGSALLKTHNYHLALKHYEKALKKDPNKISLRIELSELLVKLRQFSEAEKYLSQGIETLEQSISELTSMMNQVQCLMLLSKVHISTEKVSEAISDLNRARNIQNKVVQKLRGGQKETLLLQKSIAATICYSLGDLTINSDIERAATFYNEALESDESHEKSILALAEISIKKNDIEECQTHCLSLLRINPSQERAAMLLADIMFRKGNFTEAIDHFDKLLEKKPANFVALAQLIKLLRRAGRLKDIKAYLDRAKESSARVESEPGYHFCNGLFHLYSNNPRDALKELNYGRKSREWGQQAILHMIDIYLVNSGIDSTNIESIESKKNGPDNTENTNAAQKLLQELVVAPADDPNNKNYVSENKKKVIEAQIIVAKAKSKTEIEKALAQFIQVINKDKDNVPALVSMANALQLIKQTPKARNNLKRIAKMDNISEEDADEFERGWLLLANIYIGLNKNEEAQDQISKILKLNKSCSKAWELKGLIQEKDKGFKEASESYETAWKLTHEKDPAIGFKLAFNYLKGKRYLDAVDVCHKVLASHPRYPRIRKEILDVARAGIRP
jgi:tetratricopeptide repeat protein 21B